MNELTDIIMSGAVAAEAIDTYDTYRRSLPAHGKTRVKMLDQYVRDALEQCAIPHAKRDEVYALVRAALREHDYQLSQ